MPGANRDFDGSDAPPESARSRLALTRVLVWAEREAQDLGRDDVSARLKEVIALLHGPPN